MTSRILILILAAAVLGVVADVESADGQIADRSRRIVERAVEREGLNEVDGQVTAAVRCVFDDLECMQRARESGSSVEVVDAAGNVVSSDVAGDGSASGAGAWANYDFVPGDDVLFADDFTADNVGDFPRRLELIQGSWDIILWEGTRYLRATSNGLVAIPLPRTLPDRFTIEYPVNLTHGNAFVRVVPRVPTTAPPGASAARRRRSNTREREFAP